jgi:4a-hydroxytetrahydrobiopterin dehydratase
VALATQLLSEKEMEEALCHLPGWSRQGNKLHRQYHFSSFEKALGFFCGLALVAEAAEHPLEESEVYNSVTVNLTTPQLGGITQVDVALAEKADVLANSLKTF